MRVRLFMLFICVSLFMLFMCVRLSVLFMCVRLFMLSCVLDCLCFVLGNVCS